MRGEFSLEYFLITLIVIICSISLHEFGHAISADRLGDPGPRRDGRVTLWPDRHFDPIGFLMILLTTYFGFGIGWGKPVLVNPDRFRHPRRDLLIVAAFGPLMNLLLALAAGGLLRMGLLTQSPLILADDSYVFKFAFAFLTINLSLMFFNLLPLHPLDGGKILSSLLPERTAEQYDRVMWQWGPLILMIAVMSGSGILGTLIGPAVRRSAALILGLPGFA